MTKTLVIYTGALLATTLATQAATVAIFTGGDVGEGIDFSGDVIHAINIAGGGTGSPAAPDFVISGVIFRDAYANAPLITDVAPNWVGIDDWGFQPSYASPTLNDTNLSAVMWDIGHGGNTPSLIFTNLAANQAFKMQVLASDNGLTRARGNSYEFLSGDLATGTVVDSSLNNDLTSLQGGAVTTGVVITLLGTSDSAGTLSFRAPDATGFADNNSIASALILTQIPEPSGAALCGLGSLALILRRRRG